MACNPASTTPPPHPRILPLSPRLSPRLSPVILRAPMVNLRRLQSSFRDLVRLSPNDPRNRHRFRPNPVLHPRPRHNCPSNPPPRHPPRRNPHAQPHPQRALPPGPPSARPRPLHPLPKRRPPLFHRHPLHPPLAPRQGLHHPRSRPPHRYFTCEQCVPYHQRHE